MIPLSDNALAFLPERGKAKKSDLVFPNLPDQPGNADVRTTQIYAKIVDENKRKAVNLVPKL